MAHAPTLRLALCVPACAFLLLAAAACGGGGGQRQSNGASREGSAGSNTARQNGTDRSTTSRPAIVVLGDSLTAGLGIAAEEAYPAILQQRLDKAGLDFEVVNAGRSGDTSAGGLRRLDWALDGPGGAADRGGIPASGAVRVLILALGANDGLRGLPVTELSRNLAEIIKHTQARGVAVVLAGMEAPPNFGHAYTEAFHHVYPTLARELRVPLVPFLLEGVAGIDTLNQPDGLHPTAEGARIAADNVWAVLEPVLHELNASRDRTDPPR